MALLSSLPVIENYQYRGQESVSDSIFAIKAPTSMWLKLCTATFYHMNHCAASGHVVKFFIQYATVMIISPESTNVEDRLSSMKIESPSSHYNNYGNLTRDAS